MGGSIKEVQPHNDAILIRSVWADNHDERKQFTAGSLVKNCAKLLPDTAYIFLCAYKLHSLDGLLKQESARKYPWIRKYGCTDF